MRRYLNYLLFNFNKMKKLVLLMMTVAMLVAVAPSSMATDICSNDPLSSADFYVKTNSAVFLRDISCMDSNVTATIPGGELLHVIGKTEDWHKVVRSDGSQGWLWVTFLDQTNESFVAPESEPEPEPVTYDPMYDIYGHKYEDAVWHVYNDGIVGGYEDGSYRPDKPINRAELLKIIVESAYDDSDFEGYANSECFTDVDPGLWYTPYVCFAEQEGIVEGYLDGSFKPDQEIIFVEALKIVTIGFGHEYIEGSPWYRNTVEYAESINSIPLDIVAFNQEFKRGQMAEMITRMLKYQESQTVFEEYVGDSLDYKVTYETIEDGLNVETVVGTGQCIDGVELYDDGISINMGGCNTCTCDNGNWLCIGLCE